MLSKDQSHFDSASTRHRVQLFLSSPLETSKREKVTAKIFWPQSLPITSAEWDLIGQLHSCIGATKCPLLAKKLNFLMFGLGSGNVVVRETFYEDFFSWSAESVWQESHENYCCIVLSDPPKHQLSYRCDEVYRRKIITAFIMVLMNAISKRLQINDKTKFATFLKSLVSRML